MKRFRLLKQEGYSQLVSGRVYDGTHAVDGAGDFKVSVLGLATAFPDDWAEVVGEDDLVEARICAIEAKMDEIDRKMDELLGKLISYTFREFHD